MRREHAVGCEPDHPRSRKSAKNRFLDRSENYDRVLIRLEDASHPAVYYLIDLAKSTANIKGLEGA